jgi:hypothetical protein
MGGTVLDVGVAGKAKGREIATEAKYRIKDN